MKDPAFLFYSSDFLTGVIGLTMEERGQYITLLCLQHQQGPLSEKTIRLCLGLTSLSEIPDVLAKFTQDENGLYFNERLNEEISKRAERADNSRKNGAKGGRPKKPKQNLEENLDETHDISHDEPKKNLSENENENINKDSYIDQDLVEEVETNPRARGKERKAEIKKIWDSHTFSPELGKAVKDWGKYKLEKRQEYKPEGLKSLLTQVQNKAAKYGDTAVIELIRQSMAANWQGIAWDKLQKWEATTSSLSPPPKTKSFSEIIAERAGGDS